MQFVAKIAKRNLIDVLLKFLAAKNSTNKVHAFFKSNTFISNVRLKLAKNQAKVYWHPEAELLLFENYTRIRYSRKFAKNKCVCFNEIV